MESTKFHKLQTKKTTKPQKHHRQLRKIANLLRYAEVCVVLVLVSRLSINLPTTLKTSSDYFRNFMGSPRFVFFLGNVIIITLFAQSGQFSNHSSATKPTPEPDLYLEFLHNSTMNQNQKLEPHVENRPLKASGVKGHYRRCESEIVKRVQDEKARRVLQRCETEKVGVANSTNSYPEDRMSNDEFRRKVEAFIARQQKLRTQETL
ncbi:uncharacterized protein LOC109788878 [Cajanus cajan]|uniref:DUF4408 domain-containing protein n=1 Tax=Cajanus cajan TaxID=3821 RepID=A0A151R979_CAJCA|nr:uncharacterized protein LOC109788878 [Cajanus cajan]KYP39184.1 hypothetical protein KK1_039517 [Cajanus cajan]